jgi:hydrogenase expression/formation protein HypE
MALGGTIMQELIGDVIVKSFGGSGVEVPLEAMDDSAVIDGVVLKSDSHTVKPLFFPGGDIGRLAVAGTVNDIAVMGAEPLALASGFIIEEGSYEACDRDRAVRERGVVGCGDRAPASRSESMSPTRRAEAVRLSGTAT